MMHRLRYRMCLPQRCTAMRAFLNLVQCKRDWAGQSALHAREQRGSGRPLTWVAPALARRLCSHNEERDHDNGSHGSLESATGSARRDALVRVGPGRAVSARTAVARRRRPAPCCQLVNAAPSIGPGQPWDDLECVTRCRIPVVHKRGSSWLALVHAGGLPQRRGV